jgi:hypothetical protein
MKLKKIDNSVLITLIIVGGIVLLALFGNFSSSQNTITSQGSSSIKVLPDIISVYFNVQTEGNTASEASNKNDEIVDKMNNILRSIGFEEDEIQTQGFNVYPNYDYQKGNQITGYTATHSIKIEVFMRDKEKIGNVIDAGINSGAGISYINYELTRENQNMYKAEALKLATEDAKIKAGAIAEGTGRKLGSLVSISTSDFGYVPWLAVSETQVKDSGAEIATQITPSEQEISAMVTAVFKIR